MKWLLGFFAGGWNYQGFDGHLQLDRFAILTDFSPFPNPSALFFVLVQGWTALSQLDRLLDQAWSKRGQLLGPLIFWHGVFFYLQARSEHPLATRQA